MEIYAETARTILYITGLLLLMAAVGMAYRGKGAVCASESEACSTNSVAFSALAFVFLKLGGL